MIYEEMRKRRTDALRSRDMVAKEVLNVALGDIEMEATRGSRSPTDEDCLAVVRKLVKSNEQTLASATDDAQRKTLEREISVLRELLPKALTADELVSKLAAVRDAIRAAGNDGQATGIAMKQLRADGVAAEGKTVTEAVKAMRAE